ncbi:hypothetical protein PISMIDRAFT_351018 [Pisolithus microcarpus 441]|uniref:Peptidase S33 tripeptidyl aminopeptidase-like C-terminal domain-containing protein n=1 Tax=Pisolithus microcarpus 441 TaxID=765257 RepID=A0A0C9YL32_9AGAM|nr:hypothetical protein BKA83DRAFT_351018 [Pisolithus microcarpus]KIK14499.1 hypothetical protein PISMIDRAFT_351018 [Pisolithus microcarpus 441]
MSPYIKPSFCIDIRAGSFISNTSYPILLIGNTVDPKTPWWAAKKMSKGFPGSVVLTKDSPGVFREWYLPEEGTVCPVLAPPLPPFNKTLTNGQGKKRELLVLEERVVVDAVVELL